MKSLFAAFGFLTILPVPEKWRGDVGRSVPAFPAVGIAAGLFAAACDILFMGILPPLPASVLTVLVMIGISGGLHIDGLSDTADGFLSARDRDRALEIMRDPHIGVMGVLAIVGVILLKVSLLNELTGAWRVQVVFLMPLAGRCGLIGPMTFLPYARSEGLATKFLPHRSAWHALWALAVLSAACWWAGGAAGLIVVVAVVILDVILSAAMLRRIGGMTGDTIGATCELAEIVPALVAVILYRVS